MNETLGALGLPREDPRRLWSYVGDGARTFVARALGDAHAARVDDALALFLASYGAHLLDTSAIYPGMLDAIDALADAGAVCSVLTNKLEGPSRALLHGLGLDARFARVIAGDTLPTRKPDPTGLRRLIDASGIPVEATLMIGDSPIDVATGRNAGVATCGVTWGFGGDLREAGADALVDAPAALVRLVRAGLGLRW